MINIPNKDSYNTNLSVHVGSIAYDRKIYREMGEYIKKNVWDHMDEKLVKDIFIDMSNEQNIYKPEEIYSTICKQYLPKIEKQIDKKSLILPALSFPDKYIDRLIKQQIKLFTTIDNTQLAISKALVIGTKAKLAHDKETRTITVTPLTKTIIANILTLLIMQEQEDKKPKITPKKTIHMVRKNKKTVA